MGLMKKLTSAIVASSLVLSLVGTAFAAYTPAAGETAGNRMMALKVLNGKTVADPLSLKDEITRAELVTIIVRAFGQEENAKLLVGASAFPDTAKHWASGNIAMAKALVEKQGDSIGMPDGTFAPDAKLTPAQAVAFLMKFLGVKADATKTWPANYLDAAVTAGLIASGDKDIIAPMLNDNATRGLVFYLFDSAFYSYDLGAGKTFYTKYVDMAAPVITLGNVEKTTLDSKVTISGKADGAKEVYVGTTAATLAADGTFSVDFNLPEMKEYTIAVTARDTAGNAAEKSVSITRTVGDVAAIEAADITVGAGGTVEVKAVAKDAKGNTIANAAITGESTVGTFAAGVFTGGATVGTGTLTLKAGTVTKDVAVTVTAGALAKIVSDKASVNVGEKATLTGTDANGNVLSNVTFTMDSADANVGPVNGVFIASKAGSYTVTAKAGDATATLNIGVFGAAKKLAVVAPAQVVANDGSKYAVTVNVIDENGNLVTTDSTTEVTLTAPGYKVYDKDKANMASGSMEKVVSKGSYTFYVTAPVALQGQIVGLTAADTSATVVLTTSSATNVEAVRQVATSLKLGTSSSVVKVNDPASVTYTATVLDQKEVAMKTGTFEVKTTLSGPAKLDVNNGTTYTFTTASGTGAAAIVVDNQQGVTGTISLTATVDGIGTQTKTVNAAVAGAAAKVVLSAKDQDDNAATSAVAGKKLKVKAEVQDANGIPVNYTGTLEIKNSSTDTDINLRNDADSAAITNLVFGGTASSMEFLVYTTGAFTGNFDLTVGPTTGLTKGAITLNTTAGKYTHLALDRADKEVSISVANPTASLTAQLYDAYGNKVSASGVKLTFKGYKAAFGTVVIGTTAVSSEVTFNGTTEKLEVATDANGAAVVTVGTRPFSGTQYAVSIEGLNGDNNALLEKGTNGFKAGLLVTTSVANTIDTNLMTLGGAALSNFYLSNTTAPEVLVKVTLKDNYGAKLNDEKANLKIVADEKILWNGTKLVKAADYTAPTFYGKGDVLPVSITAPALADGEYYAVVQIAKAGLVSFGVKHEAGPFTISGTKSLLVSAATATKAKINEVNSDDSKLYVKAATVAGPFTVQLTDDYGNAVTSVSKVTLNLTSSTASVRKSASDITATSLDTYGTVTIYVTTQSTGNYVIDFGTYGSVNVVAE